MEATNIPVINEPNEQDITVDRELIKMDIVKGVTSVNGMQGDVTLNAEDVGALPNTTEIPEYTSQLINDSDFVTSADVPVVNNAALTIQKNGATIATFTANSSTATNANIQVPISTSELTNNSGFVVDTDLATVATTGNYHDLSGTPQLAKVATTGEYKDLDGTPELAAVATSGDYEDLTNKPTVDTSFSDSSDNAIANSTVTASLDRNVVTDIVIDPTVSTTTLQLDTTKTNLKTPSSTVTTNVSLPVASSTQAGIMNSSTYDAVTANTTNINAIINGAVAITGLAANPSQNALTTAWQTATGITTLMNRAGIYDVTNSKYWTYYTNDTTWHYTTGTSTISVSTFTNSSEGLIKGSTVAGQVFAENDGTGSVNGWDTLNSTVGDHTSKLATIEQGAEVNVNADWDEADSSSDAYILNKPSLAAVATSGDYTDLSNTPSLATVATTGQYSDLSGTPTIPTAVSQLSNDSGYQTASDVNGTTESYTIATSDWTSLASSSPFTYSATVAATYQIGADTLVHLMNDQAIAFANYGFAVASVSGQNVTIYSIGAPDSSITLKINYREVA